MVEGLYFSLATCKVTCQSRKVSLSSFHSVEHYFLIPLVIVDIRFLLGFGVFNNLLSIWDGVGYNRLLWLYCLLLDCTLGYLHKQWFVTSKLLE